MDVGDMFGEVGASEILRTARVGELTKIVTEMSKIDSTQRAAYRGAQEFVEAGMAACALLLANQLADGVSLPFSHREDVAASCRRLAEQIFAQWRERDEAEGRPWRAGQ